MTKKDSLIKLEDDPIWKEACDIAEIMYGILDQFPRDEQWYSAAKLKASSNDLMYMVSQAIGEGGPRPPEYEWGNARKYAFALQTMYRFAGRQKFIDLDPEIMVRLTNLVGQIDQKINETKKKTQEVEELELKKWQERYRMWESIEGGKEDKK